MKDNVKNFLCLILVVSLLTLPISAQTNSFSWYCKRNLDHKQPTVDSEMRFVEDFDGYYVDRRYENSDEKVIYLTFDAGYENGNVAKILDILKEEKAVGSFFILETLLIKNLELVRRMADEGNLVCNHTSTHKDVSKLSFDDLKNELEGLEKLYKEKTGRELTKYFRPPEGRFSKESMENLQKLGYTTVFWSFAYADWDNNNQMPPDKALEKVMSNIHNGGIMLLHPTSSTNVQILPEIIKQLKAQGYHFKTLDNLKKPPNFGGFIYSS